MEQEPIPFKFQSHCKWRGDRPVEILWSRGVLNVLNLNELIEAKLETVLFQEAEDLG